MPDEDDQQAENAFDTLVSVANKSGNLRKHLDNNSKEINKLSEEIMKVTEEMARTKESYSATHLAPSMDDRRHTYSGEARQVLPSKFGIRKQFLDTLKEEGGKRYRITLQAKNNSQSTEWIRNQLKYDINLTDIKVGIKAVKTLRDGRILIETCSEK